MFYKTKPEDFIVEEVPLYEFTGEGEHLILRIRKTNKTTLSVIKLISSIVNVPEKHIGYAGLKDKVSISIQFISIPKVVVKDIKNLIKELERNNVEVLNITYHKNKLKPGHLKGNIFTVKLKEINKPEKIIKNLEYLSTRGILNYYDTQRFSDNNIEKALKLMKGEKIKVSPYEKRLVVSALTSAIFNEYLKERVKRNLLMVLPGDIIINQQNFKLSRSKEELEIAKNRIPTGPIWGTHMMEPSEVPGELEREVLRKFDLKKEEFKKLKVKGTRRAIIVFPEDLEIIRKDHNEITLKFFLPRGSYATVLLKELEKNTT